MKTIKIIAIMLFVQLLFVSCSKDNNPPAEIGTTYIFEVAEGPLLGTAESGFAIPKDGGKYIIIPRRLENMEKGPVSHKIYKGNNLYSWGISSITVDIEDAQTNLKSLYYVTPAELIIKEMEVESDVIHPDPNRYPGAVCTYREYKHEGDNEYLSYKINYDISDSYNDYVELTVKPNTSGITRIIRLDYRDFFHPSNGGFDMYQLSE